MNEFEERRIAMVDAQLRPSGITDAGLLAAMARVPRERFLPEKLRGLAYMDEDIQVRPASEADAARFLLSPLVQARLIQLAEIEPQDTVLDLGCATGYSAAILASLATDIIAVEPDPELAQTTRTNLAALGVSNVEVVENVFSDPPGAQVSYQGSYQGSCQAPYDAIVIEGSVPAVPDSVLQQLKNGGRLVAVLTDAPDMCWGRAFVFLRVGDEARGVPRFNAAAPPLPGLGSAPAFAL